MRKCRSNYPGLFYKVFRKNSQNSWKNSCAVQEPPFGEVADLQPATLLKTPAHVLFSEVCKICKNVNSNFLREHRRTTLPENARYQSIIN